MRSQKAGRSSGDRLVVRVPSVTTCSSTTSAPALRRSVRTLGQEVNRRPRTRSASTRVQGPWQIAATGLPESTKSRTNATAERSILSWSGLTVPPGSSRASNSSGRASLTWRSTGNVPASSRSWLRAAISPVLIDSRTVWAPAPSSAFRGCSSSTRSTPSVARIATRRPFSSLAMSRSRQSAVGVQHDLGPPLVTVIEVLIALRRLVEGQLVADDPGRRRLAAGDEVAERPVVPLHRTLAAAHLLAAEPELTEVEGDGALLGQLVRPAGVLGDVDADHADLTGEPHRLDQVVQRHVRVFLALRVVSLVAHALAAVVGAQPHGHL